MGSPLPARAGSASTRRKRLQPHRRPPRVARPSFLQPVPGAGLDLSSSTGEQRGKRLKLPSPNSLVCKVTQKKSFTIPHFWKIYAKIALTHKPWRAAPKNSNWTFGECTKQSSPFAWTLLTNNDFLAEV